MTMAAAPAAMILVRLLENISSSPVVVTINLSYCKAHWKRRGKGRAVTRGFWDPWMTGKASANSPQENAKAAMAKSAKSAQSR
jgi:hypothetical protein